MTRMIAAMAAMLLGGWLMQGPVAAQSSKPDPVKVRAAIDRYVQQEAKLKGGFFVRDAQENQVRDLTFDSVHQDIESTPENLQVVCVDFQDRAKNRLDLDFSLKPTASGDLEVTAIKIHKPGGPGCSVGRPNPGGFVGRGSPSGRSER
ncbi:MAG: hypothetical protein HYU37_08400 [Acidobacteria bacterium]|nr:hypothetical protein [Acidobacteriota bacterium]